MKKVIAVLLVMGMLCLVAGCSSTSAEPTASADAGDAAASSAEEAAASSDEVYRIGIACPLTGTSATYGEIMLAGAQIAVDEINAAGGVNGRQIELVSLDDKNDPSEAALVAQRFCDMEDIQMVIAHGASSVTLAAAPIYEAAQMPFMSPASSAPELTEQGYEYYVRFGVRDDRVAPQIIAFLGNNLGIKNIGIIFANNDYGRGNLDAAADAAAQLGMEILAQETYNPGLEKDFSTIINKLQLAGCEGMAVYMDHDDAGLYFQQAHAAGFDVPSVGASSLTYQTMIDLAGADALQNLYIDVTFNPYAESEAVVKFNESFDRVWGTEDIPSENCGNSYNIVYAWAQAIEEGATKANVAQWMKNTTDDKDYTFVIETSLIGEGLTFEPQGDLTPRGTSVLKVSEDGQFVTYDEEVDLTGLTMN